MDATILAALITAGSTILAAIITAKFEEIKNFLMFSKKYHYLCGKWHCTWESNAPAGTAPVAVTDQVEITRVNGKLVKGEGATPGYGSWEIEGKANDFAITLTYCGQNTMQDTTGAIILKTSSPTRLIGVWCQYTVSGELRSGETTWQKI